MTKPAALTGNGESSALFPCWSILTRLEAVISSKNSPYGLMRKWSWVPGTRALMCVKTRSDRKSTRLNSSHVAISYAVFGLKKKKHKHVKLPTIIKNNEKKNIKNRIRTT